VVLCQGGIVQHSFGHLKYVVDIFPLQYEVAELGRADILENCGEAANIEIPLFSSFVIQWSYRVWVTNEILQGHCFVQMELSSSLDVEVNACVQDFIIIRFIYILVLQLLVYVYT